MPTMPAMMPARSESLPSVADTVWAASAFISIGVPPYFSTRARSAASDSSNPAPPPLMTTVFELKNDTCGAGAEMTRWSSTIAIPPWGHSGPFA